MMDIEHPFSDESNEETQPTKIHSQDSLDETRPMIHNPAMEETQVLLHRPALDETRPMMNIPALDETRPMIHNPALDGTKPMLHNPALDETRPMMNIPALDETRPMIHSPALDETKPMLHNLVLDETRPMITNPALDETKPMLFNPAIDDSRPMRLQPNFQQDPVQRLPEEDPMAHYQPILVPRREPPNRSPRHRSGCGGAFLILILPILFVLGLYFFFPLRTNILLLGIDRAPEGTDVSRTDTNIILSVVPLKPVVNMLSIPRDLWVPIANVGENRINTAHFFAEAEKEGSGPAAAMQAIRDNFGLSLRYYVRIRFDGFEQIIDAMGGVTIDIPTPQAGYDPGSYHLDGAQALTFARNRNSSDDFFRMQRGQMVIIAVVNQMLNPLTWPRIPSILGVVFQSVDTNVPLLEMPRIGLALVRGILQNTLDARTIDREMVFPTTTSGGANVLLPNWDAINPVLMEMFGQ